MLREEAGPFTAQHERLVVVLDVAGIEAFVRIWPDLAGRPLKDRHALLPAFVAMAVCGLPTTAVLIEWLTVDRTLRRLCGWERAAHVPGESTFSHACVSVQTVPKHNMPRPTGNKLKRLYPQFK
jgi:hypothetical protein